MKKRTKVQKRCSIGGRKKLRRRKSFRKTEINEVLAPRREAEKQKYPRKKRKHHNDQNCCECSSLVLVYTLYGMVTHQYVYPT
jgi:hypothetical protein